MTNSSETVFLTILLNLLKSTGVVFNLPISNLLTSDFKLAKLALSAKSDVSTPGTFLGQILLHN